MVVRSQDMDDRVYIVRVLSRFDIRKQKQSKSVCIE